MFLKALSDSLAFTWSPFPFTFHFLLKMLHSLSLGFFQLWLFTPFFLLASHSFLFVSHPSPSFFFFFFFLSKIPVREKLLVVFFFYWLGSSCASNWSGLGSEQLHQAKEKISRYYCTQVLFFIAMFLVWDVLWNDKIYCHTSEKSQ